MDVLWTLLRRGGGLVWGFLLACPPFPFFGALARYRMSYYPKFSSPSLLSTMEKNRAHKLHSNPPPSMRSIIRDVYAGGWRVLYKGLVPALFCSPNVAGVYLPVIRYTTGWAPTLSTILHSKAAAFSCFSVLFAVLLIDVPATILSHRAFLLPEPLPWLSPSYSLTKLLTPSELHRPYTLYTSHLSLVLVRSAHLLTQFLLIPLSMWALVSFAEPRTMDEIIRLSDIVSLFVAFVPCIILAPLENISARLAIERTPEFQLIVEDHPLTTTNGQILHVRSTEKNAIKPYMGVFDAGKSIVVEEGWHVLYRLAWLVPFETLWMTYVASG